MQRSKRTILSTPDRILVATDLTDLESLLPHAIIQARTYKAPVILVHAISAMVAASVASTERIGQDPLRLIKDVRHALQDFVTRIEQEGVACSTAVRIGSVSEVIREQLLLPGSARIIMGTHGRGKLRQLALGSVAHSLIAQGDVSILIVGPQVRDNAQHATPRHILHPVSFLGEFKEGARLAFDLAKQFNAGLTLLHVLAPDKNDTVNPARMVDWATNALQKLLPSAPDQAAPTQFKVVSGKVADQILRAARDSRSDWIVLNTDEGTTTGVFNESRAFEVLAASECPVLTFRF